MGSTGHPPPKHEIAREIQRLANTLSEDIQTAARAKVTELGIDVDKGRLSLEETLLNLSSSRDVLIDAVETGKLSELPLKLQYSLHSQLGKTSADLTAMATGTDNI